MDEFKDLNADNEEIADAADKAEEAVEEIKETADNTVDIVEETAEEAADEVKDAVEDTVSEVKEDAENMFSTLTGGASSEESTVSAPKKKNNNVLIALLAVGLAVIVALVAVLIFVKKDDKNTDSGAADTDTEAVDTTATADGENSEAVAKIEAELKDLEADGIAISNFNYSEPFDDNGYWKGIKALDYVTLCDYKAIPISKADVEVSDDTIQQTIDQFLSQHTSTNQIKDRAVADGDTVNIDYVGSIDGVEFEGGNTGGAGTSVTIGVTSYIDDFLEQLIGHMPGDSFDVEVTFPEDYIDANEDAEKAAIFNGKDAVFKTTINYIEEQVTPEFNDEFVKNNLKEQYGWETANQAREEIYDNYYKNNMQTAINEYLLANAKVSEVPEVMKNYQISSMFAYYQQGAQSYEMSMAQLINTGMGVSSVQELLDRYEENFTNNAKYDLIMQAIAEDSGSNFSADDLESCLKDKFNANLSDVEGMYGKNYLMYTCLNSNTVDMLIENAVVAD